MKNFRVFLHPSPLSAFGTDLYLLLQNSHNLPYYIRFSMIPSDAVIISGRSQIRNGKGEY